MDLEEIHKASSGHEKALSESKVAGCFYCMTIYNADIITEWICDPPGMGLGEGRTAHCPNCWIDAVLPGAVVQISDDLLQAMNKIGSKLPYDSQPPARHFVNGRYLEDTSGTALPVVYPYPCEVPF